MAESSDRLEILQGTLDLMIMRILRWGPQHGHGIATAIRRTSGDAIRIEGGSLYPALQRLVQEKWVEPSWGTSANNRRARFYKLTAAGRRRLAAQESSWERLVRAMRVIGSKPVTEG